MDVFSQLTPQPAESPNRYPVNLIQLIRSGWGVVVGEPNSNDDSNFRCFCALKFVEYTEYQGFRQVNGLDWVFGRPVTGTRCQRVECRSECLDSKN